MIPPRAVLVEKKDRLTRRTDARLQARGLDLHERDEPVNLGLRWSELGQDAAEPERIVTQGRPQPVVAGRGRVALIEDEVDDVEY